MTKQNTVAMVAIMSITASQSPTGKAIPRGGDYAAEPGVAAIHVRRGLGKPAPAKAAPKS